MAIEGRKHTTATIFLLDQKGTNTTLHDKNGDESNDMMAAVPGEEANGTNGTIKRRETTSGLSPVTQLSGVLELQQIMAGSVPDATPPSQNVLGSPPKRDIDINPLRYKLDVHGAPAGEDRDVQVGVAIPSTRQDVFTQMIDSVRSLERLLRRLLPMWLPRRPGVAG